MSLDPAPNRYALTVERPASLIALALNIVLGVALAIALILKVYMLVLTDLVCSEDVRSLGNLIRCTDFLELAASFLAASATVAVASALLIPRAEVWTRALGLAVMAAFVSLMNLFLLGDYNWRLTLAATALFTMILAMLYIGRLIAKWLEAK